MGAASPAFEIKRTVVNTPKTFYWLKLKADFFSSKEIRKLRSVSGGAEYVLIYQEMLIYSLPFMGILFFDGFESDISAELALVLGAKVDDVRVVVNYLLKFGLMEQVDDTTFRLTQVEEMTGRESESAARVRKHREKMVNLSENGVKTLQCNNDVTNCNTEREKEIDKEIDLEYRERGHAPSRGQYENVNLTGEEYEKLKTEFPSDYEKRINRLSEYIKTSGKKYDSHYAVIIKWAREDEERQAEKQKNAFESSFDTEEFFTAALARSYGNNMGNKIKQK